MFRFRVAGRDPVPTRPGGSVAAAAEVGSAVLALDIGIGGWMLLLHFNEFMSPAAKARSGFSSGRYRPRASSLLPRRQLAQRHTAVVAA